MTILEWINPAEQEHLREDDGWAVGVKDNTDQWGNHCREWRATAKQWPHAPHVPTDFIVVHSGTDGVSMAIRGQNNGFIHFDKKILAGLIAELKSAGSYSKRAQSKWRDYWRRRNALYRETK